MEAVYFGKVAPSSDGVIYDESGNGNDAQLVNSYCIVGDGTVYADGNTENIHNGTFLDFDFIFKVDSIAPTEVNTLYSKGTVSNTEFVARIEGDDIKVFFGNGTLIEPIVIYNKMTAGTWHRIYGNFNNGVVTLNYDGVMYTTILSFNTILNSGLKSQMMVYGGAYKLKGAMSKCQVGYAEYNLAEGGLCETLINTGTAGGNAQLVNAVLADVRAGKQDIFHYNILNGFDLYSNGVAGEEIRIPIGKTFSQAGYSYVSTNQAGKWDNNSGSELQLPASLSSVQDATPISSLTNNAHLKWVNGEIREFIRLEAGESTITEVPLGTRMRVPFSDAVSFTKSNVNIKTGKSYNVYIEMSEYVSGYAYISLGGAVVAFVKLTGAITSGVIHAIVDTTYIRVVSSGSNVDLTLSKVFVWEVGTVPPLSYQEWQSNFNEADIAFSNTEENKHKKLALYSSARSLDEVTKIEKCIS